MLKKRIPFIILLFFISLSASAQTPADSVGTIRVKKKPGISPDTVFAIEAFMFVEQMPSFPEGEMTMNEFIDATFIVPQQALDRGVSGTIVVSCMVDVNGELKDIRIARGLSHCPDCNAEALRVVNQMPLWTPGRQNGRAVPVMVSIPVKFRFKK